MSRQSAAATTDLSPQSDVQLIARAQAGDKAAAGELLARHYQAGLRLAQRIADERELARELTQEAMLAAFLSLKSLRQPESFSSWFYGIVLNVCRDYLRTRHANPLSWEALQGGLYDEHDRLIQRPPDPQSIAEARELHDLIIAAIHSLSPKNREATLLFYFQQLSIREIAMLLGISVTAVKGRLHKSRKQLRAHLTTTPLGRELEYQRNMYDLAERKRTMIRANIVDVIPPSEDQDGPLQHLYTVLLLDIENSHLLTIKIGPFEGMGIAAGIVANSISAPRPFTYDLMANLLDAAKARPTAVQISAIEETTFFATVVLQTPDGQYEIDARPSDALALAVRVDCPIYVAADVMKAAGKPSLAEDYAQESFGKGLERYQEIIEENRRLNEQSIKGWQAAREQEEQKEETKEGGQKSD